MSGGTISGKNIGVCCKDNGSFTMSGGTINGLAGPLGIGIYLEEKGIFTINGNVDISGAVVCEGYSTNSAIYLDSGFVAPVNKITVGVTTELSKFNMWEQGRAVIKKATGVTLTIDQYMLDTNFSPGKAFTGYGLNVSEQQNGTLTLSLNNDEGVARWTAQ
jgi:hypothetical protein